MSPSEPPRDRARASTPEESAIPPQRRRWYAGVWFWLLVVVIVGAALWFWRARTHTTETVQGPNGPAGAAMQGGFGKSGGGGRRAGGGGGFGANQVMPVGTATAKVADVPVYLAGLGSVTPVATVTVKARVDGQLVKLNFREGQLVKPNEVLAEIDPRPFQVVVTQAEGQLARDQALLANAKVDLERYRTLVAQDSIATQQLDTQKALVSQYEGSVRADRGNLDSARLQLSFTKVLAPVGGRIGLKQVDVGNMIRASDTTGIVVITQLQPIDVVFAVPEIHVHRVMQRIVAGQALAVDAFDRDSKTRLAQGTLLTVDNQIDVTTGTVKLKGRFANAAYELFPNQFVNARVLLETLKGVLVVPQAAVQRGAQGFYVYVVNADHTVTARTVATGLSQGDQTVIATGVKAGEVVVVDGTDKLREGAKVEPVARDGAVVPPSATPPAEAAGTPEERRKRWEAIDKRIDAGEFGEEIRKLPEEERRKRMQEMRKRREGGGAAQ